MVMLLGLLVAIAMAQEKRGADSGEDVGPEGLEGKGRGQFCSNLIIM